MCSRITSVIERLLCHSTIAAGHRPPSSITRRLVERFARPQSLPVASHQASSSLTPRELDVLKLMARAMTNAEIAENLCVSEATVKTHVARILGKLDLRDRAQAVVFAYEAGISRVHAP